MNQNRDLAPRSTTLGKVALGAVFVSVAGLVTTLVVIASAEGRESKAVFDIGSDPARLGRLALDRGDPKAAVEHLEKAALLN